MLCSTYAPRITRVRKSRKQLSPPGQIPHILFSDDDNPASLDLLTARHRQTLLATHLNGKPLRVEHGAPLRLVAPVKLGLKNIKAITRITYLKDEPAAYRAKRGYSRYDGI